MKNFSISLIGFACLLFAFSAHAAGLGESCTVDLDCDDEVYCNGIELCSPEGSICVAGEPVDCGDQFCNETSESCVDCLVDEHCNDTQYCNGVEICDDGECFVGDRLHPHGHPG